jgi:hypothetical protein
MKFAGNGFLSAWLIPVETLYGWSLMEKPFSSLP